MSLSDGSLWEKNVTMTRGSTWVTLVMWPSLISRIRQGNIRRCLAVLHQTRVLECHGHTDSGTKPCRMRVIQFAVKGTSFKDSNRAVIIVIGLGRSKCQQVGVNGMNGHHVRMESESDSDHAMG